MSSEFRRFLGVARKLWNTMQKKILKFSWYIWNFSGLILHSFKRCISHSGRIWKMHCRCLRARGRAVLGGHGGPVSLSPLLWYPQWPRHSHRGVGPQPPDTKKTPPQNQLQWDEHLCPLEFKHSLGSTRRITHGNRQAFTSKGQHKGWQLGEMVQDRNTGFPNTNRIALKLCN